MPGNRAIGQYRRMTGVLGMAGHSPMLETGDQRCVRMIASEALVTSDAGGKWSSEAI